MTQKTKFNVCIAGATGAVGREVLSILEQRKFPIEKLRLFASARGAGQKLKWNGKLVIVEALTGEECFDQMDVAFFTAGSTVSEKYAFKAAARGALVIDNASIFRMREDVPLVVPEVNAETLELARKTKVVANPNCTTAQMVVALKPLHDLAQIKRVVLASYQAVSGKGQKGIEEFTRQIAEVAAGKAPRAEAFPHPIAFNCLPHIDVFQADGFTGEEHKVMAETRKILGAPKLGVLATCVRVPVMNCHSESVTIETEKSLTVEQATQALRNAPGVRVVDDPVRNEYPLATQATGKDEVFVGRIRKDLSLESGKHGLTFWVVADNLRKGAALNAVQIAEAAAARGLF